MIFDLQVAKSLRAIISQEIFNKTNHTKLHKNLMHYIKASIVKMI